MGNDLSRVKRWEKSSSSALHSVTLSPAPGLLSLHCPENGCLCLGTSQILRRPSTNSLWLMSGFPQSLGTFLRPVLFLIFSLLLTVFVEGAPTLRAQLITPCALPGSEHTIVPTSLWAGKSWLKNSRKWEFINERVLLWPPGLFQGHNLCSQRG